MIQKNTAKLSFRYDINALRAIAILGVIFFHYKLDYFSGGFAGVDIFFVISGYLMSKIIINAIDKNEFSFKIYLGKRLKRIVPALLFLILVLMLIPFFFYLPEDYQLSQKSAAGSILFLSNILYWLYSGSYFAPVSDTNILLHTWSLSVEWQFYLIYPFFLLLHKIFKTRLLYLAFFTGLTLCIFAASVYLTGLKPAASFYLLPTRSWEMLFGGLALFAENVITGHRLKKVMAIAGYLAILACFLFLKVSMPWPGLYTLLPVLATFLIIIANFNGFKLIRHISVQFIGKISYSLYLWHWPVYVISQYLGVKADWESAVIMTALSVLLGFLSFRYIETLKIQSSKVILAAMAAVFIGTAALSFFDANRIIFDAKTLKIAEYSKFNQKNIDRQFSRGDCFIEEGLENYNKEKCLCIDEHKSNILLLGDSHAAQLAQSLSEKLSSKNVHLMQATAGGIFPSVQKIDNKNPGLRSVLDYVYQKFVPENAAKIDAVIITAHWAYHKDQKPSEILKHIQDMIRYFQSYHIKVMVIGQIESYIIPYPTMAAKNNEYQLKINRSYLDDQSYSIDKYLSDNLGAEYIRVINTDSFPELSGDDIPYMWDRNHVTKYGADFIVEKVFSEKYFQTLPSYPDSPDKRMQELKSIQQVTGR
jgi:peptidoglycan/LPS O-acetylase OafA/YrhL